MLLGFGLASNRSRTAMSAGPMADTSVDSKTLRVAGSGTAAFAVGRRVDARVLAQLVWLVRAEPKLRWATCLVDGKIASTWPRRSSIPYAVVGLAARAAASNRITRTVLDVPAGSASDLACQQGEPGVTPELPVNELLAVPETSAVVVFKAVDLNDLERAALSRRVRARDWISNKAIPQEPQQAEVTAEDKTVEPTVQASVAQGHFAQGHASESVTAQLNASVLAAVNEHGDVDAVALTVADMIARLYTCRRVSIGLVRRGHASLIAMSGEARADPRREPCRSILAVIDDALSGGEPNHWPRVDATTTSPAALRQLFRVNDGLPLISRVASTRDGARVAMVLEGLADTPDESDNLQGSRIAELDAALPNVLTLLGELDVARRGTGERTIDGVRSLWRKAAQGKPSAQFCLTVGVALLLVLGCTVPVPYRVSAKVVVEASDRQLLTASTAGHLASAHARAGDKVRADDVLATLDERELVLASETWLSEISKNRTEQAQALAQRNRVELARLRADAERLAAELGRVEDRRARAIIRAPFDGLLLSGDPTRSLGAPITAGEVLFEIARSDRRSLQLEIDERDVADLQPGGTAEIRMAARPRQVLHAQLEKILPVAVAVESANVFRVRATLAEADADIVLNPGMQGVARVDAGRRPLLAGWTRALRHRVLVTAWSIGLIP